MNNLMKGCLFIILFLIHSILITAGEKITDFRYKLFGPLEKRIYLVDNTKKMNYGYYSVRPMIRYSTDHYMLPGQAFMPVSIDDKTIEEYNHKADLQDVLNMMTVYYNLNTYLILTSLSAGLGFFSFLPGVILLGIYQYYHELIGTAGDESHILYRGLKYTVSEFFYTEITSLYIPAIALLASGASLIAITGIFMGIMFYYWGVYKSLKKGILNSINTITISDANHRPLFKLTFDLVIN